MVQMSKEIETQEERELMELGLGTAHFLRDNRLDVDFLSKITWNGKIDSDEARSHDQRIDELTYAMLTGDAPPETSTVRQTRRSRSVSPRRVNQEELTLEERLGPRARYRIRSAGWRPLRSLGQQPPVNTEPFVKPSAQPSSQETGMSTVNARPSAEPPCSAVTQTKRRPSQGSNMGAQEAWAWRYGRGGQWHSVRGCTIEVHHGSLLVRRSGALQQALPCTSVAQAVTYGNLGRLIVAAVPGVDSLFLSLDKDEHAGVVAALATYGITVQCVGYADFFALQKQLVFPASPLFDPPRAEKKAERRSSRAAKATQQQPQQKATQPQPTKKQVRIAPDLPPRKSGGMDADMQAELSKQLSAIHEQREQLARLEAQLLRLAAAP